IPAEVWDSLRPNVGWWWVVFGFSSREPERVVRSSEIWCLIKHRAIARIQNSGLRYPDGGHLAPIDLGSVQRPGFSSGARSGERPQLAPLDPGSPWARRAPHRKAAS